MLGPDIVNGRAKYGDNLEFTFNAKKNCMRRIASILYVHRADCPRFRRWIAPVCSLRTEQVFASEANAHSIQGDKIEGPVGLQSPQREAFRPLLLPFAWCLTSVSPFG